MDRLAGMAIHAVAKKYGVDRSSVRAWSLVEFSEPVEVAPKIEPARIVKHAGIVRAGDTYGSTGACGPFAWDFSKGVVELRSYESTGAAKIYRLTVQRFRENYRLIKANPKGQLLLTAQDV